MPLTPDIAKHAARRVAVAVALVAAAALLRFGLLRHMGLELPYITFYPAVAIAALYGGRLAGLVSTTCSAVFVYFWQHTENPSFQNMVQWEGMAIFVITGIIIAQVSEVMLRARAREAHAEDLARIEKQRAEEAEQARQKIADSEQRFISLFENSPTGMVVADAHAGRFIYANRIAQQLYGYSEEELRGQTINDVTYPDDLEETSQRNGRLASGNVDQAFVEKRYLRKDGTFFWAQASIATIKGADGKVEYFIGSFIDITEKKRVETALAESELTYQSLFDNMLNGFAYCRMLFEDGKPSDFIYLHVNNAFETLTGLRSVVGKRVSEVIPGFQSADRNLLEIYGRVSLTGKPERFEYRVEALRMWFWISVYSPKQEYFIALFDVITDRKEAEEKIATYITQLEGAMEKTLRAISQMVEQRDPYTAGHERRVGIIAADIAREMGWPDEKCRSLQLIGLVHDIGKISVPAEILSKPARLTPLEYELVKGHVRNGYDILKDIDFPWPAAEIIYQHHERMDGSGYPRGLKGADILPEARILAVADVVESMSTHRPYRPALGVEAALKEISGHRGSLFDAETVDAMVRLIREKAYRLPD